MSKIIELSFEDDNRNTSIADLFESIEFYRSQGRSLSAIYSALKKKKVWTQSESTFAHQYYQYRRQHTKADPIRGTVSSPQSSYIIIS